MQAKLSAKYNEVRTSHAYGQKVLSKSVIPDLFHTNSIDETRMVFIFGVI